MDEYNFQTMNINCRYNFVVLCILSLIIGFLSDYFLSVTDLLTATLASDFSQEDIEEVMSLKDEWRWLGYVLSLLLLLIKIMLVSTVLYVGTFLFNKKISFISIWRIAVKAEFIFLFVGLVKFFWFYFFQSNYSLEDIQYFYPLSALNIVGYEDLAPWFIYPFQVLNLFELAYWFLLAYLLGKEINIGMDKGFKIVASSYVPALLIWVVTVMFLTLNVS